MSRWADRLSMAGGAAVLALMFCEFVGRRYLWPDV